MRSKTKKIGTDFRVFLLMQSGLEEIFSGNDFECPE